MNVYGIEVQEQEDCIRIEGVDTGWVYYAAKDEESILATLEGLLVPRFAKLAASKIPKEIKA